MTRLRERGVALVTAILMVAIATALATKLVWDNQLSMRRTEANLNIELARQLALGAEAVAAGTLAREGAEFGNNAQDLELAAASYEAQIDDISLGLVSGQLLNEDGRMNINALVSGGAVVPAVRDQFGTLFDLLQIDRSLIDMITDWIDPDSIPAGAGTEDSNYMALDPPYRPANNYLDDISELRAIGGITDEIYLALLPHVRATPPGWCGETARVNFNFATPEVMAAIAEVDVGTATFWAEQRNEVPWEQPQDVPLPDEDTRQRVGGYISVTSTCFRLSVIVDVGSTTLTMYSLLDRSATNAPLVVRARGYGLEY